MGVEVGINWNGCRGLYNLKYFCSIKKIMIKSSWFKIILFFVIMMIRIILGFFLGKNK